MKVSVLGRIGYDLFAEDRNTPLAEVSRFSRYLGGSSANIAVGLRRLGAEVGIISCVGEDAVGEYLIQYLRKEGVETRFVKTRPGWLTSLCLTEVSPPDRFPQVFYRARAADTQVELGQDEKEFIRHTRLFATNGTSLCATPARESTYRAMEWAHAHGVRVAFDVDYRAMSWAGPEQAAIYARLALPYIDVFIANPEEIRLVTEMADVDQAIASLSKTGVPLIAAKLGSEGTLLVNREHRYFLPPYPVPVVSTIGAGDGFASGFLYALLEGQPLPEALKFGNAAAAIVVSRLMCSEAMPALDEVRTLIREHPEISIQSP